MTSNEVAKTYTSKSGSDGKYEVAGIDRFGQAMVYASGEGYVMRFNFMDVRAVAAER